MLTRLEIRNLAIIEHVALDLAPGFNVLTGETGAGKSILIDALGLVLGDRADTGAVRRGAGRAEISAILQLPGDCPAADWLRRQDLDQDDECVIRRVIDVERGSRAYINGRPATTQQLRELGEQLIDIHGQHAHQSLLRRGAQRALLDEFAGHHELLARTREAADSWQAAREALAALQAKAGDEDSRLEWLRYQVEELEALELGDGELEEIEAEHRRQANMERLLTAVQRTLTAIYEGEDISAYGLASQAQRELEEALTLDPALEETRSLLTSAAIQLQEAGDSLRRHLDTLELDPQRLQWLEQRMGAIHALARKHNVAPEALAATLESLRQELAELETAGQRLQTLRAEADQAERAYRQAAGALSEARRAAAERFGAEVSSVLQTLGMPDGSLSVEVRPEDADRPRPEGVDQVEMQVAMNPGQPARPLAKVASGGELSRISLAIQVVALRSQGLDCMVFDEVDAGIGGAVAEIVGRQLATLAAGRQVLCVTHLAQVAACADSHLRVEKLSDGANTTTRVVALDADQRVEEIARMLGGIEITERSRAHAREMMAQAQ